jgi:hypothetical protein
MEIEKNLRDWKTIREVKIQSQLSLEEFKLKEVEVPEKVREEFLEYAKEAKLLFEEVIGKKINGEPEIHFFSSVTEEVLTDDGTLIERETSIGGLHSGNEIWLPVELLGDDKKTRKSDFFHEYFHWVIQHAIKKLKYNFDECPELKNGFALHFWLSFVRFAHTNFLEEGTAELSGAISISKNEKEVPKNLFKELSTNKEQLSNFYFQYTIDSAIEGFYNGLQQIKKCTKDELLYGFSDKDDLLGVNKVGSSCKLISEYAFGREEAYHYLYHYMGKMIVLFAYETYKREGKNAKQLLKDLILSPYDVVEKVVREIRNDNNKELLKAALSDLTFDKGWARLLRHNLFAEAKNIRS